MPEDEQALELDAHHIGRGALGGFVVPAGHGVVDVFQVLAHLLLVRAVSRFGGLIFTFADGPLV
jgi:hypothetical protein